MTTYYTAESLRYVGTADDPECGFAGHRSTRCDGPLAFYINDEPYEPIEYAICERHIAEQEAAVPSFAWSRRRLPTALTRERRGSIWRLFPDAVLMEHGVGNR